ncbi:MAG TPA: DUF1214 domain-containing protein [Chitinophagaceae bacterium]
MKIALSAITVVVFFIACNNASDNKEPAMDDSKNQNGVIVTADNFVRAESDMYFAGVLKKPGSSLGKIIHDREIASVDNQPVIRYNRDVLVSSVLFDLDAGPATIIIPDPGKRFFSILVVTQDHYNPIAEFGGGTYTLTKENVGTRYALVALRLFVDPNDPKDMKQAHDLQDAVTVNQPGGPGKLELPVWDSVSQNRIRDSLLIVSKNMIDFNGAFGTKDQVDPAKHLVGTASGWGGNPSSVAVYKNFTPAKNDGITKHKLHVPANVPVDAFWSVAMYNAKGYFEKNDLGVYNLNSITSKKNKDGSVDIQFGGCDGKTPNCIPIVNGWNYLVRLYRPHKEIMDDTWKFPEPQELK